MISPVMEKGSEKPTVEPLTAYKNWHSLRFQKEKLKMIGTK